MDRLKSEFETLGFENVSTFIASGNVLFDTNGSRALLEAMIEARLGGATGDALPTLCARRNSVMKASALEPYGDITGGDTHHVLFLRKAPTGSASEPPRHSATTRTVSRCMARKCTGTSTVASPIRASRARCSPKPSANPPPPETRRPCGSSLTSSG